MAAVKVREAIMARTQQGVRCPPRLHRFRVILTACETHDEVTLESLLHKAWEALSAKR